MGIIFPIIHDADNRQEEGHVLTTKQPKKATPLKRITGMARQVVKVDSPAKLIDAIAEMFKAILDPTRPGTSLC